MRADVVGGQPEGDGGGEGRKEKEDGEGIDHGRETDSRKDARVKRVVLVSELLIQVTPNPVRIPAAIDDRPDARCPGLEHVEYAIGKHLAEQAVIVPVDAAVDAA